MLVILFLFKNNVELKKKILAAFQNLNYSQIKGKQGKKLNVLIIAFR